MTNGQFDAAPHLLKMVIIRCGEKLSEARGEPKEADITALYLKTSAELGVEPIYTTTSGVVSQPEQIARQHAQPVDPIAAGKPMMARKCPKCGELTFHVFGIRPSSDESEKGKYLSLFECTKCGYVEKSTRTMIDWVRMLTVGLPPARECPACHKNTSFMMGICGTCAESENGKFKVKFECSECGHTEKSTKPVTVWFQELGVDFGTQTKRSLGVRTVTDEGVK